MTYGIGLIGNRAHQNTYGPIIHARSDCRIVAAAEHDPVKGDALGQAYGVECARAYDAVLEDPAVDIVSIATDFYLKRTLIKKAIECGKHILVDKPLARTVREAREIADAARDSAVKIVLSYPQRFDAATAELARRLKRPECGRVVSYTHHFVRQFPDSDLMQYVSYPTEPRINGGGELMNLGSHPVDYLYGLYGMPKRVYCRTETAYWPEVYRALGTEDMAFLLCEYDGFTATIVTGRNKVTEEGMAAANSLEVVCQGEHMRVDGDRFSINGIPQDIPQPTHPGPAGCVQHLIECIEQDQEPRTGIENGVAVAELTTAAYQSAQSDTFIELPLNDDRHPQIADDQQLIDGLLD
jgi:myo-inositol 2-dehydrogenase/D-chiro-inositol 1-dehydrogenase